ncbi:NHLP family bacteriocin export ABC transporter peptidase/permease/ATPase subunit [Methylovulum psychrotolerans]|uniref:NHLP family bacteriocin export ABC transporter peptidase/permease/ATPase subunit n=1 Tax=Methylovulum psychrotolerans TaxID=1704499 RepID=A0A2S5CJD2_9GAMM|nr:NHLP family bacteriocin export ABC transporter peptidase/permease/ATPase subunit [Methylovulum psychrotolerans]POZ50909.1 NHLP family bacteriocin export ABC transporter peptidase/permease/ATPase subunit [Methylovulum psychrotolerans]
MLKGLLKKSWFANGKASGARVRTPTVLQMEAVECGAAALAIVLGYYGRFVPLEELRVACGVSRDGSKASNVVRAARTYGLIAKGMRLEPGSLAAQNRPLIVFWNFNHFLVLEGFGKQRVYLNDPATGPRTVTAEEFNKAYTGVALTFEAGPEFCPGGQARSLLRSLKPRLKGTGTGLAFVLLASLALVIPGLVIPIFTQVFVDNILIDHMGNWLRPLLVGMVATALLRGLFTLLQQTYLLRLEMRLALTSSSTFIWHVLRLPVEFFNQRYAGDITMRVFSNDSIAQILSGDLATNAANIVSLVFFALIMFQYDWMLTLVGIAITAINYAAFKTVARLRKDSNMKLLQDQGKLNAVTMGGVQAIETIKATGAESDFFSRWAGHRAKVNNTEQGLELYNCLLAALPTLLSGLTSVAILGLGGLRVINGELTVGMLVAFQSLMSSFTQPVTNLMGLAGKLQQAEGDLARLDDVLHYKAADWEESASTLETEAKLQGELELRNLCFGYSRLDPPLIDNFNLHLQPGQRVALVGASGSGKSTIAKLVMGLNAPWSGDILLDGIPKQDLPRLVLHASLNGVDQDVYLFEGTVRDNLSLWDDTLLEVDIIRAAKDACIHDAIISRAGGYGSLVEEGGTNYSGGMAQRLEIARALASNPRILVMDEATAALDPSTEKQIDDHIRQRGCTCLIVAHRLSTIRDCDEIIVMERGRIIERGNHEQLLNLKKAYYRLVSET